MAYASVGSGQFHNTGGATGSVGYTPTSGNTLIVVGSANTATSGLTLSDGNNTYNFLGNVSSNPSLGMWWANVTSSGAQTIALSGTHTYGLYVGEYSGLATSPYLASSFQSQQQNGPGVGVNILTTTSNPNATTAPAMVFAFSVNAGNALQGGNDAGPALGTSFAFNSRTVGWIGGAAQQSALAEDIRVTSTGTQAMTFGTVSGNQFDTFITIAAAFQEPASGPPGIILLGQILM